MANRVINPFINRDLKIGILGGGQLGKMYCEAALPWNWEVWNLDSNKHFPAGQASAHFVEGDFTDYDDVVAFGQQVDVITIEIEKVNVDALEQLENKGKIVHPSSKALRTIGDKGLQKQFYEENDLPTAKFTMWDDADQIKTAIQNGELAYPFVQKARTGGYDGRGVAIIRHAEDQGKILDTSSIIEPLVDIELELSVIVVRNQSNEVKSFPVVSMEFHPEANLVEFLKCPSGIGPALEMEAIQIAQSIIEKMEVCGLLAVEMFLTKDGKVLINEVAPRPHNSGHQTIESCSSSQYQMGLFAICGLSLPDIKMNTPSVMINVLGAEGYTGPAKYQGVLEAMNEDNVHVHLYGKAITKPFRKMGHVTVLDPVLDQAVAKANKIKKLINVIA